MDQPDEVDEQEDQPSEPCGSCGKAYGDHPVLEGEETLCAEYAWEAPLVPNHWHRVKLRHPWVQKAIFQNLEMGGSVANAAAAAGVADITLKKWLQKGSDARRDGKVTVYSRFLANVDLARAKGIQRLQAIVANSAIDNPEDAKWMLQRLDPATYADRAIVVIQQERTAIAIAMEKEFENEPETLRRLYGVLAGAVLPGTSTAASEARLVGAGQSAAAGGVPRPVGDGLRSGSAAAGPAEVLEADAPESSDGPVRGNR